MNSFGNRFGSQRVAAAVDFADPQAMQRRASLAQVENYWNALRGPRLLPLRTEIDPRAFKGALEYCFAVERPAPGRAQFCVVGSHLSRLMGQPMRGMPISSLLTAGCQEMFAELLEDVFESPATASLRLSADTGSGRPPLQAWMNLLPVGDEQGDTSRVIGVLVSEGEVGTAPPCFGIEKVVVNPLLDLRMDRSWGRTAAAG